VDGVICHRCKKEFKDIKELKEHLGKEHELRLEEFDPDSYIYVESAYVKDRDMLILGFDKANKIDEKEFEIVNFIVKAKLQKGSNKIVQLFIENAHIHCDLHSYEQIIQKKMEVGNVNKERC